MAQEIREAFLIIAQPDLHHDGTADAGGRAFNVSTVGYMIERAWKISVRLLLNRKTRNVNLRRLDLGLREPSAISVVSRNRGWSSFRRLLIVLIFVTGAFWLLSCS